MVVTRYDQRCINHGVTPPLPQRFLAELLRAKSARVETHTLGNLVTHQSEKLWLSCGCLYEVHTRATCSAHTRYFKGLSSVLGHAATVRLEHTPSKLDIHLWSTDTYQNKLFADQYHLIILAAKVLSSGIL